MALLLTVWKKNLRSQSKRRPKSSAKMSGHVPICSINGTLSIVSSRGRVVVVRLEVASFWSGAYSTNDRCDTE
jgi:hypothetical protein